MERVRVVDLRDVSLERRAVAGGGRHEFDVRGARRVVVAWSGPDAGRVRLHVRARAADGPGTAPYVLAEPEGDDPTRRRSRSRAEGSSELAVDEVRSSVPLASIAIEAEGELGTLSVAATLRELGAASSTPVRSRGRPVSLDIAPRSQYDAPREPLADEALRATARAWCAPASLAMLLEKWGTPLTTETVAAAVFDRAYGGTGNWSYGAGFAARFGFAAVAYLTRLAHARRFVEAGFPLALSFAWHPGELPGAPLGQSRGHLAVLRGFDAAGDPAFADPAQPSRLATYDYDAFERAWMRHGGVALLVATEAHAPRLIELANATEERP